MSFRPLAAALVGVALLSGPALADEKLPPDQQAKVEEILKKEASPSGTRSNSTTA